MQQEKIPVKTTAVKYVKPMNGNTMSLRVGSPNNAIMYGFRGSKTVVKFKNIPKTLNERL